MAGEGPDGFSMFQGVWSMKEIGTWGLVLLYAACRELFLAA